jgi:uncharacterized protein (UPF0210 family)
VVSQTISRRGPEREGKTPRCGSRRIVAAFCLALLGLTLMTAAAARAQEFHQKPKVRAITAFVRLDREQYRAQIAETLKMLRAAKAAIEQGGYEVESIRITTQPFPEIIRGLSRQEAIAFLRAYDELAVKESFDTSIGPAMQRDTDDSGNVELLGEVLTASHTLEASLFIAGEDGLHPKSIRAAAKLIKYLEEHSPRSQSNFNFAATAMLEPYAPFYPGSYHLGDGRRFAIGLESANIVEEVFAQTGNNATAAAEKLAAALAVHARAIEAMAQKAADQTGWTYVGLDPTPAPLKEVSIGAAIEKFTGARFGSSGTLAAAAVITKAVKAVPVKQIGYAGLMLPVLEDTRIAQRWSEGAVNIDALLAYSAVCGTGLDTIPLPGDVTAEQLERILSDVASLAVKWHKPLTARLQPVAGKKAGERSDFDDPFLTNATIQPLP